MQVSIFRIRPWKGQHNARRFRRLRHLLDKMSDDIGAERDALGDRLENAAASAAFAFVAIENGENPQKISVRIDVLTASIVRCTNRLHELEHEADFIDATRQQLALLPGAGSDADPTTTIATARRHALRAGK